MLLGWVHRVRDLGGVLFFDMRDRSRHHAGRRARTARRAWPSPRACAPEFVVPSQGVVERALAETVNPKLDTGEIEVIATRARRS